MCKYCKGSFIPKLLIDRYRPSFMDSESSSNPFVFASALEEGHAQELQMVSESEPNSTSAANPSVNPNTERNNEIYTVENLSAQDVTITWIQPTIVMACSSLLALLGISYIKNKGKLHPETLFMEPMSFDLFLTVLMLSFYFAVNGAIFGKKSPDISRASTLIALISMILSFTVLLWTLLPSNLSWQPWVFFTFTIAALIYHCGKQVQGTQEESNMT